jgi:hypothetical protein
MAQGLVRNLEDEVKVELERRARVTAAAGKKKSAKFCATPRRRRSAAARGWARKLLRCSAVLVWRLEKKLQNSTGTWQT